VWAGVCVLALGSSGAHSAEVDVLIRDVTIVSGERATPLPDAWVAIRGQRIAAIGQGEPSAHEGAIEIDGGGAFLTPGLVDSHVHLASIPGLDVLPSDAPPELQPALALYEKQLPRSYLFHGFTTVIDLNVVEAAFLARFESAPLRPDLYHCGGALALANGYPMAWVPPEVRFDAYPNFLWDDRAAESIPERFAAEDHGPAAAVQRVAESGGICVKTFWEDGFGPQKIWPTPSKEQIAAVIDEGHARQLTVTMHANSLEAHRFATEVGVDVIVHGLWNWDGESAEQGLPAAVVAALDAEVQRGIGVMPTTRVLGGLRDLFAPGFLDDPRLGDVVPRELLDWYRSERGQAFKEEIRGGFDGADDATVFAGLDGGVRDTQRVVSYFAENGGRLVFGSDTPSAPTYANPPGLNGALEIEHLAAAGVTPRQLLVAATIGVAEAFHLQDEIGTVEVGKRANLLLLRSNPLEAATAWSEIETVIVGGVATRREKLSARTAAQAPPAGARQ
jgi:imidazolonepropionase-like amidohydrolase